METSDQRVSWQDTFTLRDLERLICHRVLELIPNEGLEELQETLVQLLDFYSRREGSQETKLLPSITTEPVSVGEKYQRLPFYVTEE